MQRVVVVGAGVIGLSCAVRLAEAGYDTHVLARDLPLETTSAVAGGLWMPYLASPRDRVAAWAATTLHELTALAGDPATGVRLTEGHELHREAQPARPAWATTDRPALELVPDPVPGYASGWQMTVPVAETTTYLPWLAARLASAGGTVTRMPLAALPQRGVVVNATGVSARATARDPDVRPVRGQVVVVANPGLTRWWCDDTDPVRPLYAIPRGDHVVVGGTADDGEWDTTPQPAVAQAILRDAGEIDPRLRTARVLAHRVGLRPARPQVRLETVADDERAVVHCYGHGGSGITLSWGCADEVLQRVSALR